MLNFKKLIDKLLKNKKMIKLILLFFIILIVLILLIIYGKTDGMEQAGIKNVSYRIYTKEKGWSKWSKNGIISGDKINSITDIQMKSKAGSLALHKYHINDGWSDEEEYVVKKTKNKTPITGIRIGMFYDLAKDYDICYRTYNIKDKWLAWNCDKKVISGNKKENITAIEIKLIPQNVVKYEYLKDYGMKEKVNKGFDENE